MSRSLLWSRLNEYKARSICIQARSMVWITYDMITFLCSCFQIFRGNTNAYNYAAIQRVDNNIRARAVRFIPLDSVVQACMRIQICGKCKSF